MRSFMWLHQGKGYIERICAQELESSQRRKRIELAHRGKKTYCVNAAAVH